MNFKTWKTKTTKASEYCNEHEHLGMGVNTYRRLDCEECIWNAAYEKGRMRGKEELAKEIIEIGKAVYKNDSKAGAYDAIIYKCQKLFFERGEERNG